MRLGVVVPCYRQERFLPRTVAAKTTGECALLLVLSEGMAPGVELTINKVGTNVVVSWPASASARARPRRNAS